MAYKMTTRTPISSSVPVKGTSWGNTDSHEYAANFSHEWKINNNFQWYLETSVGTETHMVRHLLSEPFSSGQPSDKLVWTAKVSICSSYVRVYILVSGTADSAVTADVRCCVLDSERQKCDCILGSGYRCAFQGGECIYVVGPAQCLGTIYTTAPAPLLSNGSLTLYWEILVRRPKTDQPQVTSQTKPAIESAKSDELAHDLASLLTDGLFSNVTIIAGGREFKVHKNILSARSPVFRAMFEHDMQETVRNQVTIEDLSSEVVQEMLTFVYTGQSPNMKGMAADLLRAADKYNLKQLKTWSEQELGDRLSPENFVETVLLADQHSATELMAVCMEKIPGFAEEVVKTEGWSKLAQVPELMAKIVVKLATK